jgi:hypothetical protein
VSAADVLVASGQWRHTGRRLVQLIDDVLLVLGVGGAEAKGREQALDAVLVHMVVVGERRQRVGAASQPRCASLQTSPDVSARRCIRPQRVRHWDAYIRSKPAPEPAQRRAAWSNNEISSCRGADREGVAERPSSCPRAHLFSVFLGSVDGAKGCSQSRHVALQTARDSQTCSRLQPCFARPSPRDRRATQPKESSATVTPLVCRASLCAAAVVHSPRPVCYLQRLGDDTHPPVPWLQEIDMLVAASNMFRFSCSDRLLHLSSRIHFA